MGNYQSNGNITINDNKLIIEGKRYIIPDLILNSNSISQEVKNNKVKINGWKFRDGYFYKGFKKIKAWLEYII